MTTEFNPGGAGSLNEAVKQRYEANADTNVFTDAEKTKLSGVATGATANSGALADLNTVDTAQIDDDAVTVPKLAATGTASSATFLRGDNTWATPAGSGDVSKVGTPANDQVGVWTGDGTIEGTSGLTYNGTAFGVTGNITVSGTVDGRDVATDGTKLDGIEASATADQTDSEIETAYNNQVGQVSAGEKTAGTETAVRRFAPQDIHDMIDTHGGAGGGDSWGDVVDADIVPDADSTRDLGATATRFAQAYVDEMYVTEGLIITEAADHPIATAAGIGQIWVSSDATQKLYFTDDAGTDNEVLTDGNIDTLTAATSAGADELVFGDTSDSGNAKKTTITNFIANNSLQVEPSEGGFANGDKTKLDGIEASADVTDAANVAAAGAVMDGDFSANGFMRRTGAGVYDTDAEVLLADTSDQLTAGFNSTDHAGGTQSSGTYTPDPADSNFQQYTNGGAHTLAPPGSSCSIVIQITNNASAGAITTSGFTQVTGDAFTTTNGDDFLCVATRCNGFSTLNVTALQ